MAFVVRVVLQSRSCFVFDAVGGFSRGRMKTNKLRDWRATRTRHARKKALLAGYTLLWIALLFFFSLLRWKSKNSSEYLCFPWELTLSQAREDYKVDNSFPEPMYLVVMLQQRYTLLVHSLRVPRAFLWLKCRRVESMTSPIVII